MSLFPASSQLVNPQAHQAALQNPRLFRWRFGPHNLQHVNLFGLTNGLVRRPTPAAQSSVLFAVLREGISLVPHAPFLIGMSVPSAYGLPSTVLKKDLVHRRSHQPEATP